jgi:threonine/homoserine/homoserine lactone efflux protein
MRARSKNLLSLLFLAGGACLFYMGAREYLDSRAGQYQAAREFERPVKKNDEGLERN